MDRADVVIIGGGVMGSSVAYHLKVQGFAGRVVVLERDPTYQRASTALSVGGIRQQFGTEVNIRLSRWSVGFYETFADTMAVDGERPDIQFRQCGYLFLATERGWEVLRRRHALQRALGAEVELLDPSEILRIVPDLNLEGIVGASFGRRDGYLDPYSVMQAFARKAKSLGASYAVDEVVAIDRVGGRVAGVRTGRGTRIAAGVVVNAAGPWSGEVARLAGVSLPVEPVRRQVYVAAPARPFAYDLPLTIDPTGLYFRSETGGRVLCGRSDEADPHAFDWSWDRDGFLALWPLLARRLPACESLQLERGWAGLYDMNVVDHNAIVGEHPGRRGFYCITGFSGHGLQQAPAAGCGLAQLIRTGRYEGVDLTPLGVERFQTGHLVLEEAVI